MKDEHDSSTLDMIGHPAALMPACAKLADSPNMAGLFGYFVPVLFAANDWHVTPRRIRALLAAGRLAGRRQENGYWEVLYPYAVTLGRRGPALKRQKKPERKTA